MLHYTNPSFCNDKKPQQLSFEQEVITNSTTLLGIQIALSLPDITTFLLAPMSTAVTASGIAIPFALAILTAAAGVTTKRGFDMAATYAFDPQFEKKHPVLHSLYSYIPSILIGTSLGIAVYSIDAITALGATVGGIIGANMSHYSTNKAIDLTENFTGSKIHPNIKQAFTIVTDTSAAVLGSMIGAKVKPIANAIHQSVINFNILPVVNPLPITEVNSLPITEVNSLPITEVNSLPITETEALSSVPWCSHGNGGVLSIETPFRFDQYDYEFYVRSTIVYTGESHNTSLTIRGCDIPLVDIPAIHHCRDADLSGNINHVFQLIRGNITALRSDISKLEQGNHCSCGYPPFLADPKRNSFKPSDLLSALQIPTGRQNASSMQKDLRNNFVRFQDPDKTQLVFSSQEEFALETILQCKQNISTFPISSCTYNFHDVSAYDFPQGEYYQESNPKNFQRLARDTCCKASYSTQKEQTCCQQASRNAVSMDDTPLDIETMDNILIQNGATYIPINNSNPHIYGCPDNINIQNFTEVFDFNCGYVSVKQDASLQDLNDNFSALNCSNPHDLIKTAATVSATGLGVIGFCAISGSACLCYHCKKRKHAEHEKRIETNTVI
ncbi:MAG: hypothetical protein HAW62_00365 [Endozoicomonadaceae bacterium]|nr:hypothetical protein [Endozoicomonadaceae bacterium]